MNVTRLGAQQHDRPPSSSAARSGGRGDSIRPLAAWLGAAMVRPEVFHASVCRGTQPWNPTPGDVSVIAAVIFLQGHTANNATRPLDQAVDEGTFVANLAQWRFARAWVMSCMSGRHMPSRIRAIARGGDQMRDAALEAASDLFVKWASQLRRLDWPMHEGAFVTALRNREFDAARAARRSLLRMPPANEADESLGEGHVLETVEAWQSQPLPVTSRASAAEVRRTLRLLAREFRRRLARRKRVGRDLSKIVALWALGMEPCEIARRLGKTSGAVRTALWRAYDDMNAALCTTEQRAAANDPDPTLVAVRERLEDSRR